jgi:hypothetical protein
MQQQQQQQRHKSPQPGNRHCHWQQLACRSTVTAAVRVLHTACLPRKRLVPP